ncbi:MAG: type II secretion system protein, partial [Tepidisphaeraceae bacterium]
MTPTPRPNPSGRRRPTGFSMIEILAVIAILAILGSLLYVALRQVGRSTKVNATRTMMENLRGMLAELDATTKLTGFPDGTLNAPGDVTDEQSVNDRTGDQCLFTRVIIAKLTALPNNKTALGKLPPERLMTWAIVPATPPPWGNGTTYTPGMRVRTTPPDRDWVCIREHTSATANDEPGSGANYTQYWTPQPA